MVKPEHLRSKPNKDDEDEDKDEDEDDDEEEDEDGRKEESEEACYNSDGEYDLHQLQTKYIPAFVDFLKQKDAWRAVIPRVRDFPWQNRARAVMGGYGDLLMGLHHRPRGLRMMKLVGEDELSAFCKAIEIGWRLWPDSWPGLQMMLDYLAESVSSSDLSKLHDDVDFLALIKDIAQTKDWPNNQRCGPMMTATSAKTILARVSHNTTFGQVTTISIVRRMAGIGFTPSQPNRAGHAHGSLSSMDTRLMCDNPTCINVEKDEVKFGKCSNCKKVAYCCTGCQLAHWKSIHKRACGQ